MQQEEERVNSIVDRLTPLGPPDIHKRANWDRVHTRLLVSLIKKLGKIYYIMYQYD